MASSDLREFKESPFYQGEDEILVYIFTVPTSWGTAVFTSLSATLYEDPNGENADKTATMLSGATASSGQVITTPAVTGLTKDKKYRLEVKWKSSENNTLEAYAIINGIR